ncbi:MAG: hypothetical protein JRF53_03015 [Deltaproteobacteria bacterium]|nr:hypothetical protein [Deltaproteobacteria bacterium]
MDPTDFYPTEISWQKDSFRSIKPEEFKALGIDPADIPLGTFAARKHPSQLHSRFGGNAYGFGFFEIYDRLKPKDLKLFQSITFDNPDDIAKHYKDINEIYSNIGLLTRFSNLGKPYYLIPVYLLSNTLTHVKSRVDEISKIVGFHRKKYFKEYHSIGLVTHQDDLITRELSFRFKEHNFVVLDSLESLRSLHQTLDLVILTRDLYEIIFMEKSSPFSQEVLSRKRLEQYAIYILWKIYNLLKPDGEIFIIANHYTQKTNRTLRFTFKTTNEERNFILFSHIFKTRKKYKTRNKSLQVNIFDFQKYLSGLYVEQEVIDKLLGGKSLEKTTLDQLNNLPYINFQLTDSSFSGDQGKTWSRLLSVFFDNIFLKPLIPQSVKEDWKKRFSFTDYAPNHMLIYLGQKKPLKTTMAEIKRDVMESKLIGCPPDLLAEYKNSFDYVIRTLRVLYKLKKGSYKNLPQIYLDRLTQPLENKRRRFSALNDVIKLTKKIRLLEKIGGYLNPDNIEGSKTKVLENLEIFPFFGFSHNELKEIFYIVLGHTPLGRIISGKTTEKALKPVSDLARSYDQPQALNLLRYCRLMTMAEIEAFREAELTEGQLTELFALYESTERVVTNRELDWDRLMDEKITSMGGIHHKIVRKLLKMINHLEFLDNWSELRQKGEMEKESLADYDDTKLLRIENVIKLVNTIEQFEERFLKFDPLQLPVFYRKFLDIEFHGTGHLFERMDSENVFVLLWIAVNLARGEIINFNPILADTEPRGIGNWVKKVENEVRAINLYYLDLAILRQFSDQLYQAHSSFIIGTGFHLRIDPKTQALEITYMDMARNIEKLESLIKKLAGHLIREIEVEDLKNLEVLFSNLENFYQSQSRLLDKKGFALKLPAKQNQWFERVKDLREQLRSNFLNVIFHPKDVYTDLELLRNNTPSLLNFILPEFTALEDLDSSWHLYLTSPVTHYIATAAKKIQALIRHDKEGFQDTRFLHSLAQREFGPMATGIVGFSESQIEELENIVDGLGRNKPLFDALIKSFILQDIGRVPGLREKYKNKINPADLAHTGSFFIEKEKIAERYYLDKKGKAYLIFLVRHHGLLHHIIRGELSFYALQDILDSPDRDLLDAFFVFSFIMISAIREDLILEDLAGRLFRIRDMCHKTLGHETDFKTQLHEIFTQRGNLFYALENYKLNGLPEGVTPADYLESQRWEAAEASKCIRSGKMIFAMERLFRLRGIRYLEFLDLSKLMLKVPLKFIYKKRKFSSIGYATYEKEVYEAFRIYNTLQNLEEETRHFILNRLVGDKVRIFGYEKVSGYLSYENQLTLLLAGLLGSRKFEPKGAPVCLNFLVLSEKIEKRYEAVNDYLSTLSLKKLWEDKKHLNNLFKAKTGIVLRKESFPNVLSIDFHERINIPHKIAYMDKISDVEQLKNYFHYSLQSLRKHPFQTDDYELEIEKVFEKRLVEITDMLLNQTKKQMDLIKDFSELHNLVEDLFERSYDIGFSDDQKNRLKDLYELRKDTLKRDKLSEIDGILETIQDIQELKDYWESIKWYLQNNRWFFGKEFENLIATKFDGVKSRIEGA